MYTLYVEISVHLPASILRMAQPDAIQYTIKTHDMCTGKRH